MTDEDKIGTRWSDDELDLIVADYFAMLGDELTGRPYVKSHHRAAMMQATGRGQSSVEFKHQNISAVLDELGLPWITGYKPRRNYQSSIFEAIDRYLTEHGDFLTPPLPRLIPTILDPTPVFVDPPPSEPDQPRSPRLSLLLRKFDPAERDRRNRALGAAGESFVLEVERRRLEITGRADLARKVRWVSAEDGDGAGYDVRSYHPAGGERLIEVKTTNGAVRTPFFLTRVEHETSTARPEAFRIYRVHLFAQTPRIFTIAPPLGEALNLRSESWRASLR